MGTAAVLAAIDRVTGARTEPTETVFTPTLVVRGSTAPPRGTSDVPIRS
jgi:DNA-binding LacI/PurR family transcriptional regulator